MDNSAPVGWVVLGRPVFSEHLGKYFRGLRAAKKLGLRQAAQTAENKHLGLLTRQVIFSLEKGRTKNIEPDVLKEVAKLYAVDYEEIAARVINDRYGFGVSGDLLRHARTKDSGSHSSKGEPDVSASARERIADLERELAESKTLVSEVQNVARRLMLLVLRDEMREPRETETTRRRRDRKAG